MYSFYQKVENQWVGTHRYPLVQAIFICKDMRKRFGCKVAIVPDHHDPDPYFKLVDNLA